ncbi:DEAD/DEAH box helicase [Lewinellaceae bacterium SD302]|nr:DEAD/DEAH box helicase [Lewinellaceae bacterium SD302]
MDNFKDSGLGEAVLKAVADLGYESPTPVQAQTLPLTLAEGNRDLIALARTGTGKTAGFGLPLVDGVDPETEGVQALILCPTRELCLQIARDLGDFAKYRKDVNVTAVYGGSNIMDQIRAIRNGANIVVGTPGRTLDLINRKKLKVDNIRRLVLDEADEMLNMGFQEELDAILSATPDDKQTLLFSATMPKEARQISEKYMTDPNEISAGHSDAGVSKIDHKFFKVRSSERFRLLKMLIEMDPDMYGVIFCRTRREVDGIADDLRTAGLNAGALHGDMSQAARDDVMRRFRRKQYSLLVATDVAARGLDVKELTHVINYNLPDAPEVYIHRSGRTGRAGSEGLAFSLVTGREMRKLRAIEKYGKITFEEGELPTPDKVYEMQVLRYLEKVEGTSVEDPKLQKLLESTVFDRLKDLSREELISKFLGTALHSLSSRYQDATPFQQERERPEREKKSRDRNIDYTRLCIRAGKAHGMNPAQLIGMLNRRVPKKRVAIGKVDVQRNLTFFDVDTKESNAVVSALTGVVDKGVALEVQVYGPGEAAGRSGGGGGGFKKKFNKGGKKDNFKKEYGFKKKKHRKGV